MSRIRIGAGGQGIVETYRRTAGAKVDMKCYDLSGCFRRCEVEPCPPPAQAIYDTCDWRYSDPGWQAEFETIRLRLTDFLNNDSGLDLQNIVAVRLEFAGTGDAPSGRIAIDDLSLTGP